MDFLSDAIGFFRKLRGKTRNSATTVTIKNSNNNQVFICVPAAYPGSAAVSVTSPITDNGNNHITTASAVTPERNSVTALPNTDSLPTPGPSKPKRLTMNFLKGLRSRKEKANVPSEPVPPSHTINSLPDQNSLSVPALICSCGQRSNPQFTVSPESTPTRIQTPKTSPIFTPKTSKAHFNVPLGVITSPNEPDGLQSLNINETPSKPFDIPPSTITSNEQRFVVQARSFEHNSHMYSASLIISIIDWIPCLNTAHHLNDTALVAGSGMDKEPLWAIRAHIDGSVSPGYYNVQTSRAYAGWDGSGHNVTKFEVLYVRYGKVKWINTRHNLIPENAVKGGTTVDGEIVYVGRAWHIGSLIPGRVQPSHHCIYITYEDKEYSYDYYQILCVTV